MSILWYYGSSDWEPSEIDLRFISSLLQPEEKAHLSRFKFQKDANASLIGRLMIRKLVNTKTGTTNQRIVLGRDEYNRTVLFSPKIVTYRAYRDLNSVVIDGGRLNFTVSHQGKFTVLASDPAANQIGIDVINIDKPGKITSNLDEYLKVVNWRFTENEWKQIHGDHAPSWNSDLLKLKNLARFGCLKQAYVKAIGLGIVTHPTQMNFHTTAELGEGRVAVDTSLTLKGVPLPDWKFEERFLDSDHIVTVAKEFKEPHVSRETCQKFKRVSLKFLLEATSGGKIDQEWVEEFRGKKK